MEKMLKTWPFDKKVHSREPKIFDKQKNNL